MVRKQLGRPWGLARVCQAPGRRTGASNRARIEELEVELRAQEHRPLPTWRNALWAYAEWLRVRAGEDADDKHKQAVRRASGWAALRRLVNPATVGGTIFGVAGLIGLCLANEANKKLEYQNDLIKDQNIKFERQNDIVEAQKHFFESQILQEARQDFWARRTKLVGIIYDEVECPEHFEEAESTVCFRASLRARTDAIVALVALERDVRDGDPSEFADVSVDDQTDLRGASIKGATFASEVNLEGVNLSGADLRGVEFNGANIDVAELNNARLAKANLRGASLLVTDLSGADLSGADLRHADMRGATLPPARYRIVPDNEVFVSADGDTAVSELPPGTLGVGIETPTAPPNLYP